MNVRKLTDANSYALAPGHELRRAKAAEIVVIKETIKSVGPAPHVLYRNLWEQVLPHIPGPPQLLPEEHWRYFVIAFKGTNLAPELEVAFDLAPLELEVAFTAHYFDSGYGTGWNPGRLFHLLEDAKQNTSFFVDVSHADVAEILAVHSQLGTHDHRLLELRRLVTQLQQLKALPHHSPLRFLGYFAILESLLTHAPKPIDPYDSITRQVKKKLELLNNRFARKIDYSPFNGAQREKIWGAMYQYRSSVAHGGDPQFTGDLAVLRNRDIALTLIKETVKSTIRHALSEPQLLVDLKEC